MKQLNPTLRIHIFFSSRQIAYTNSSIRKEQNWHQITFILIILLFQTIPKRIKLTVCFFFAEKDKLINSFVSLTDGFKVA